MFLVNLLIVLSIGHSWYDADFLRTDALRFKTAFPKALK